MKYLLALGLLGTAIACKFFTNIHASVCSIARSHSAASSGELQHVHNYARNTQSIAQPLTSHE